jgi:hypothetical protein
VPSGEENQFETGPVGYSIWFVAGCVNEKSFSTPSLERTMSMLSNRKFEEAIAQLTQSLNGQLPRPWMTSLNDPRKADVFVVGKNQRKGYAAELVGGHDRHMNALFNRNGETCRELYDEVTGGIPSPTRCNTDRFITILNEKGVTNILETNVICYSSPMSHDLRLDAHAGGTERGKELFRFLLDSISPKAVVVHGKSAAKELFRVLRVDPLPEPTEADDVRSTMVEGTLVVVIRSLAPPAYNKWSSWADKHLRRVATKVAAHVR